MEISKVKLTLKYLTGGIDGVIEYLLDLFSKQVLAKADAKTLEKYCNDITYAANFAKLVIDNHKDGWSEKRAARASAVVVGLGDLANAIKDGNITKAELDLIIDEIGEMIRLFRNED